MAKLTTLGPVSKLTWMGDCDRVRVQFPVWESQPGQLSLAIPSWAGSEYQPKGGDARE